MLLLLGPRLHGSDVTDCSSWTTWELKASRTAKTCEHKPPSPPAAQPTQQAHCTVHELPDSLVDYSRKTSFCSYFLLLFWVAQHLDVTNTRSSERQKETSWTWPANNSSWALCNDLSTRITSFLPRLSFFSTDIRCPSIVRVVTWGKVDVDLTTILN